MGHCFCAKDLITHFGLGEGDDFKKIKSTAGLVTMVIHIQNNWNNGLQSSFVSYVLFFTGFSKLFLKFQEEHL